MKNDLPFTLEEYQARLRRLEMTMTTDGLDALLVAAPEDLFYLTGFRSMDIFRFQVLVVRPGSEPVMVIRRVAKASFDSTAWTKRVVTYTDDQDPAGALRSVLSERDVASGRIGVPMQSPYFTPHALEHVRHALPAIQWVDASSLVSRLRLVKSTAELGYIREACRYAEAALLAGVTACRPGRTENHVAAAMLAAMIEAGSETPAKNPLIGAGPRSAFGHVSWEGGPIRAGEPVFLEPGACVRRYHAALMRCAVPGVPRPEHRHWAVACREAVNAAIRAMRPGVSAETIDAACRGTVEAAGLTHLFHHRTGYSIGLGFSNWIEDLSLRPRESTALQAGMVFHLVPFLTDGQAGIAVSEMVLVTEDGAERLTRLPQDLLTNESI